MQFILSHAATSRHLQGSEEGEVQEDGWSELALRLLQAPLQKQRQQPRGSKRRPVFAGH